VLRVDGHEDLALAERLIVEVRDLGLEAARAHGADERPRDATRCAPGEQRSDHEERGSAGRNDSGRRGEPAERGSDHTTGRCCGGRVRACRTLALHALELVGGAGGADHADGLLLEPGREQGGDGRIRRLVALEDADLDRSGGLHRRGLAASVRAATSRRTREIVRTERGAPPA
jgi:hypothetical protein